MFRNLDKETILKFISSIRGNSKNFSSLLEIKPTLAAIANALNGDIQAEKWLQVRADKSMYLFYLALSGEMPALEELSKEDDKFMYVFTLACLNKIEGKYWLVKNGYEDISLYADEICECLKELDKKHSFWYRIFH